MLTGLGSFAALLVGAALVAALIGTATLSTAVPEGIEDPGPVVHYGIPVVRMLLDLGAVATAGLALLAKLVGFDRPDRTEPVIAPTRRLAVWTSALWGISALLAIVLLTVELGGTPTPASIWNYISSIAAGKGLLLSAGCAVLSIWLSVLAVRHGERVPAELRVGVALFGLLPLPLTGHASNWYYHDLTMISMELHVVAATAWAGGLAAVIIFLIRQPVLLAQTLPRFSKLATWCVLVVGVTGVLNGLIELALSPITALPGSLFTTRYGLLILAKTLCMVLVAVTAAVIRYRLLPRIIRRERTAVTFWAGWELVVLAVAFGVAVVLTRTPVTSL
ncbi:copper resistance protein CopD [Nakamurella sp. YIM 132087]|uniref:Copper resistance protein CopD n=1 Tax=Nakamurella alba TaxID=2665158 RepID=A0A7K1FMQ1_9ACTN|nr:copper resistance protein CopD [Nakamurella alba]